MAAARAPDRTIMVAAGDLIGASPLLSSLFHDEPTIESMTRMGLALTSVGNHEFDEGVEELVDPVALDAALEREGCRRGLRRCCRRRRRGAGGP